MSYSIPESEVREVMRTKALKGDVEAAKALGLLAIADQINYFRYDFGHRDAATTMGTMEAFMTTQKEAIEGVTTALNTIAEVLENK